MKADDFFNYKNHIKPERGRLLFSEPFLPDPNFERTVVLLCEHNDEGSFGFVINKPSILRLNEVIEDIPGVNDTVFVGGPVQQDTIHFLHRQADLEDAVDVGNGLYWGGDFHALVGRLSDALVKSDEIRFYLGYSGWGAGQLEAELHEESWIVCDFVSDDLLFHTNPEHLWKAVLTKLGGRFSMYANYPVDPRLN
jgi:putative transcriptional regulator